MPLSWAGLGLGELLALALWPLLVVAVAVGVPYWAALLVPRTWRADWRNRDGAPPRNEQRSSRIPARYRRAVLYADGEACVYCRTGLVLVVDEIHLDHRIPWSWGGLSKLPNLFTTCGEHNLAKMTYWVDRRGVEHGKTSDRDLARRVFAAENRARRNVARWWLIAWAMS
jgi:hypothetical protein